MSETKLEPAVVLPSGFRFDEVSSLYGAQDDRHSGP